MCKVEVYHHMYIPVYGIHKVCARLILSSRCIVHSFLCVVGSFTNISIGLNFLWG